MKTTAIVTPAADPCTQNWRSLSSAASTAALVGVFLAASDGKAMATDECGSPGPAATITCAGASYPTGISYGLDGLNVIVVGPSAIDGLTLVLDNPSMVVNADNLNGAVGLYSPFGSTNDLIVDIVNAQTITNTFRDGLMGPGARS